MSDGVFRENYKSGWSQKEMNRMNSNAVMQGRRAEEQGRQAEEQGRQAEKMSRKMLLSAQSDQRKYQDITFGAMPSQVTIGGTFLNIAKCKNVQIGNNNVMHINQRTEHPIQNVDNEVDSGEQITEQFPIMDSSCPIETKDMKMVASNIGMQWRRLLRNIDIDDETMEQIYEMRKDDGIEEVIYQCLHEWKKMRGHEATIGTLTKALSEIDKNDLVRKLQAIEN